MAQSPDATTARVPRVLVTGAAGYVGRLTLAALARRRNDVGALVAFDVASVPDGDRLDGVAYVEGDIRQVDMKALCVEHDIDTVVHLAFMVRPPAEDGRRIAYEVDVEGTQNVLDGCLATGVRRLIVISSGAAYGYHPDNPEAFREEDTLRGNEEFPYSHHKRLVEELLADYRERHPELQQLIFRAGTILGTQTHSPITDLFEKPVMLGVMGSAAPFNFIWDEDVVACLVAGVFGEATGIFNLAGDGSLTTREIARRLHKVYLPVPAPVLAAGLWLLKGLRLTQYGPEQVRFLRYRPVLANDSLKQAFGFQPRYSSAEVFELYRKERHA